MHERRSIYERYSQGPRRPQRGGRRWLVPVLIGLPLVLLLGAAAYIGWLALDTRDALGQVFVSSVRATYTAVAEAAAAASPTVGPSRAATLVPGQSTPTAAPPTPTPWLPPEWKGTDRLNILLLGVDSRVKDEVPRSDTLILVSIDPAGKRVGMFSIPRDLWVVIPGYGPNKINSAYSFGEQDRTVGGGPALAMRTVEHNFRVPVHHFATVDFGGFVKIIDAIGGITVDVPYALKDDEYPADDGSNFTRLYVPAGLQWMDGATALRYARSRHFDSDFGRNRRQQQVLQAIRDQAVKLKLLPRLGEFVNLLAGSVRTDLEPGQVPALARLAMELPRDQITGFGIDETMTAPIDSPQLFLLAPRWRAIDTAMRTMIGGPLQSETAPVAEIPKLEPTATPVGTPGAVPTASAAGTRPAATARPRATATPTGPVRVVVRNGTNISGLAARAADKLKAQKFSVVQVGQDPNAGKYPRSLIYYYHGHDAAAIKITQVLGLPASASRPGSAAAPAGVDVIVILGDDAD